MAGKDLHCCRQRHLVVDHIASFQWVLLPTNELELKAETAAMFAVLHRRLDDHVERGRPGVGHARLLPRLHWE
jgi:hypothetical protein